jgi:hypothetical protein
MGMEGKEREGKEGEARIALRTPVMGDNTGIWNREVEEVLSNYVIGQYCVK